MGGLFISFTSSDKPIKDALVAALRKELGPDEFIWDHEIECVSRFGEECVTAIQNCEVFLPIISDAAMDLTYVLNEVIVARECEKKGTLNIVLYQVTDRPMTKDFTLQLNHISDANRVGRMEGTNDGIQSAVSRVKYLLHRRRMGNPELPTEIFEPKLNASQIQSAGYFVPGSRDDIFQEIDDAFASSNFVFVQGMHGYGKKSTCKKYALLHQKEYKNIFLFHQFYGSLRDFFLTGLEITNINPEIFKDLSADDLIRKKVELLESFGTDTLFIVPNVTLSPQEDDFLLELLYSLPLRILFLTESVPGQMKKKFPTIFLGSMNYADLKELFFYYYDIADEEEQEALTQVLYPFFESIDGHTSAVIKTASLLAEEAGIYPEDLPEIFAQIHLDSENELGDRIFTLISEIYDLTQLTDMEKELLCLAALTAVLPMDEKQFIQMAKACGCFDSSLFKKLGEQGLLDLDREYRCVSMESFLSDVCLSKISPDSSFLGKCFQELYGSFLDGQFQIQAGTALPSMRRIQMFFSQLNLESAQKMALLYCNGIVSLHLEQSRASIQEMCVLASAEAKKYEDSLFLQTMEDFLEFVKLELITIASVTQTAQRETGTNLQDEVLAAFFNESMPLELLTDDLFPRLQNKRIQSLMEHLLDSALQRDVRKILTDYILFTEEIASSEEDAARDETLIYLIEVLGYKLIMLTQNMPYICLQLCRARLELLEVTGTLNSFSEAYIIYLAYYRSLHELGELTEEYDSAYHHALHYLDKSKKESFSTEEEAAAAKASLIKDYVSNLASDDPVSAIQAYQEIHKISKRTFPVLSCQIAMMQQIVDALIKTGATQEACDFLAKELTTQFATEFRVTNPPEDSENTLEQYDYLNEIYEILSSEKDFDDFLDASDQYLDYYQSFPKDWTDRRLMKKYSSIAKKAQELDYSHLTQKELQEKTLELSSRAKHREHLESLAPEAFALVSEAGFRILGYRHHYVQYLGAAAMVDGKIAELQNGEGKTYTILLPAFLHILFGRQVHVMDSSRYLTQRNYHWMHGVLEYLGCRVGLLDEPEALSTIRKKELCDCHLIYESVMAPFWQLRYELDPDSFVPRLDVLIADEADQLLIGQADTPLILNANREINNNLPLLEKAYDILSELTPYDTDMFECEDKTVTLKPSLYEFMEQKLHLPFSSMSGADSEFLTSALQVGIYILFFAKNGEDYYIIDDQAQEEDILTGTLLGCSELKRYFIGKKEENDAILASCTASKKERINYMTLYEYAQKFDFLCGATATATSMEKEFQTFYQLSVVRIPTNIPIIQRKEEPAVFLTANAKYAHIIAMVKEKQEIGQPVLVVAGSSPESENISRLFHLAHIPHALLNVKNMEQEADLLGKAGRFGAVTVTNALANRGVDIRLGGNPEELAKEHLYHTGVSVSLLNEALSRPRTTKEPYGSLRQKYEDLTALYKAKTDEEKKQVEAVGGLCVIGTTCFDDLRTEEQVRGRCGRQGAVGESHIFYSMQDRSLRNLIGDRLDTFFSLFQDIASESLNAPILNKTIEKARLQVQKMRFDQLFHKPELLLYPEAKKKILGLRQQLQRKEISQEEVIKDYFIHSERNIRDLLSLAEGKDVSPRSPVLLILPLILEPKRIRNRKSAAQALQQAYENAVILEPKKWSFSMFSRIMGVSLKRAWSRYLTEMEQEIPNARKLYPIFKQRKNLDQHLRLFSQNQCQLLIEDAVGSFLIAKVKN